MYRGRKLVVVYFDSKEAKENTCKKEIPTINKEKSEKLTPYLKSEIDQKINSARNLEKNRTIRAMGLPQNYDAATIKSVFETYGAITRFSLVKGEKTNPAYIVFEDLKIVNQFKETWYMKLN